MYVIAARRGEGEWNIAETPLGTEEEANIAMEEFNLRFGASDKGVEIALFELVRVA